MASQQQSNKRKRGQITYGKRRRARPLLEASELPSEPLAGPLGQPCGPDEVRQRSSMSFVPAKYEPEPLRPSSQKAATMTVEPNDEQVSTLVAVTGLSRDAARRFLRVKQCNIESATNAILDGEDLDKLEQGLTWDPDLMTADREGNANLHPLGTSAAPTRGNSPAPSLRDSAPTNIQQADADLAQALARSQEPYAAWPQQETGTVGKDGTELRKIGPSTQREYEESRWGMVLHNASELVPDVPLEDRVQQEDDHSPRFLKHAPEGHYLPNLLTICHSVPVIREAFLLASQDIVDYGYASDWWKGATIPKPKIVQAEGDTAADEAAEQADEFIAELQRLTAFLDCSSRAYASCGGLLKTDIMRKCPSASNTLEHFLDSYASVVNARGAEQAGQIAELFTTHAGSIGQPEEKREKTAVLTLRSSCADSVADDAKPDLAECLDKMVWSTDSDDPEPPQYFLRAPAKVLVIRLEQEDKSASHLNIRVPANLVMDKYAEENIAATGPLRQRLVQAKRRIKKITDIEERLHYWTKDGKKLDVQQLLKHTQGHFSGENRRNVDQTDKTNTASMSSEQPPHYAEIAGQLETVISSIEDKLELLAAEKDSVKKAISDLSKASIPGLEARESQYRYTLRGVATKPHITYLLRPKAEADEPEASIKHNEHVDQNVALSDATAPDEEITTPAGYQWWRIDYEVTGQNARLTRTKADDFDVIRAVELEHNSALLVYASDDAVDDVDASQLPSALQDFIRRDNEELASDIEASKRNPPPPYQDQNSLPDFVRSSVEKPERDGDTDSITAQFDGEEYVSREHGMDLHHMSAEQWIRDQNPDPEPVDIHLSPKDTIFPGDMASSNHMDAPGEGREMEMIEKKGMSSLIPTPSGPRVSHSRTTDVDMNDTEG